MIRGKLWFTSKELLKKLRQSESVPEPMSWVGLSLFNGVKTLHGLSPPVATPSSSAASPGLRRLKWIRFLLVVHAPRWNFSRPHDLPPSLPKMPFSLSSSENSCSPASAPRKSFFHLIDDAAGGVLKRMLLLLALALLLSIFMVSTGGFREGRFQTGS